MAHGEPLPGRLSRSCIPPDALGSGSSAGDRFARDRPRAGGRGAPGRPAPAGRFGSGDQDRVRCPGRHSRAGRDAPRCGGHPVWRSVQRPDDPRPAARRRGPGDGFDRGLGGPCPEPGSGRGRGPGRVPGVARRPRARFTGGGDRDGRIAPCRSVRRRPRDRPARGDPAGVWAPAPAAGSTTATAPAPVPAPGRRCPKRPSTETFAQPGQPP